MIHERIDLSTAPSAMEMEAQRWGARATPRPQGRPRLDVRIDPLPPRRPRPFHDAADKGQPGYFGADDPQGSAEDERRARLDAMRAVARDLPGPKRYAAEMPLVEAEAIANAEWAGNGWRYRDDIDLALLRKLRSVGLAYLEDRGLTHFACAVRRELVEDGR